MRRVAIILLLLSVVCGPGSVYSSTLQERVISNSAKYLHVRELNNDNRGPEIDSWNRYLGLPMGSPYCAAFGIWVYHESGHDLPKIGRCAFLWQKLKANGLRYKTFTAEDVSMGIEQVQAADIIIWRSGSNVTENWNGHFGIARGTYGRRIMPTREANTGPSNAGNQREGSGVFDRERGLGFGSTFRVVGFVRVRP
jgi:hypothetical protein